MASRAYKLECSVKTIKIEAHSSIVQLYQHKEQEKENDIKIHVYLKIMSII